jgi:hypothetical protein
MWAEYDPERAGDLGYPADKFPQDCHQPQFTGPGFIVTNVYGEARNSWGACYPTEAEARAAIVKLLTYDPYHPNLTIGWSDVVIEPVDFSEPQLFTRPLGEVCPNTNPRHNGTTEKGYSVCDLCMHEGQPRHWYLKKWVPT